MIEEKAFGKINLALHISGKRDDGYHDIDTVFQSIDKCDIITLEKADDIQLTCSDSSLPCDMTNLAYRAAMKLLPYNEKDLGAHIHIEKNLPISAGLAGGSSDCAAVLRGLNKLWDLKLGKEELMRVGAELGADVPFCIVGGTARGTGRGDQIEFLPDVPKWPVIILHPHMEISTAEAYGWYDATADLTAVDVEAMVQAVRNESLDDVVKAMGNTFDELAIREYPKLDRMKDLIELFDVKAMITGSGPTIFGIIPQTVAIGQVLGNVRSQVDDADVFMCKTAKALKI